jgi:hypothetical protein
VSCEECAPVPNVVEEALATVTARQTTNGRVVLNNEYDPANLFRLNQNIRPSGEKAEAMVGLKVSIGRIV